MSVGVLRDGTQLSEELIYIKHLAIQLVAHISLRNEQELSQLRAVFTEAAVGHDERDAAALQMFAGICQNYKDES